MVARSAVAACTYNTPAFNNKRNCASEPRPIFVLALAILPAVSYSNERRGRRPDHHPLRRLGGCHWRQLPWVSYPSSATGVSSADMRRTARAISWLHPSRVSDPTAAQLVPIWSEEQTKDIMVSISEVSLEHRWRMWQARHARINNKLVWPNRYHFSAAQPFNRLTRCTGDPTHWTGQRPIKSC